MINKEDDAQSSGALTPQKDYVILGNNVYERVNKRPEDIMWPRQEKVVTHAPEKKQPKTFTREKLGRAIKAAQKNFWGQSSYGVIFSAARDACDSSYTMRQFEDDVQSLTEEMKFDFDCPRGTLATAFCRNRYLKIHVDKWPGRGVKQRSIELADVFIDAMNNQD